MKRILSIIFSLFLTVSFSFAEFNKMNIPDSTEIRRAIAEAWFYDDASVLRNKHAELRKNAVGQEFQIRMEESGSEFAVIIAPMMKLDVDFYTEKGVESKTVDEYPADACGSWLLIRNTLTGKTESIRIYFSANSDMYVQFSPDGRKTLADFVIAGLYASRGVPIGIPFEDIYRASFQDILNSTEKNLPWKYADTQKGQFHSKLQMIGVIRKNLERIVFSPNSCYDENGKPVYITDGKPRHIDATQDTKDKILVDQAGFLKWIVDGLVEPVTGSHLYRNPLMVKTVEYNDAGLSGILDKKLDLSFTLDWCRNLAAACLSVKTDRNYMWNEAYTDVEIEPFSAEVTAGGITQTAGFIKNSGYQVSKLKPVLYVLASTEPTYCYLAAIKRPVKTVSNPEFFAFDECAVIFPYFDDDGRFACTIFENGNELTLNQFCTKYKGSFAHLSRILTENTFFPD